MKFLALLIALPLAAQTKLSLSPDNSYKINNTVWNLTACVGPNSPGVTLRAGDIYAIMISRRISYLTPSKSVAVLQSVPAKSLAGQIVQKGGWAAAGFAFLLTVNVVKASTSITAGVTAGAGLANVIIPLAQKSEPSVPVDIQTDLLGPFLVVPAGGCSTAYILGGEGQAFEMVLP